VRNGSFRLTYRSLCSPIRVRDHDLKQRVSC